MSSTAQAEQPTDDITVNQAQLLEHMFARIAEEVERSSDASESADKTDKFLEQTGLNSQAYSWGRSILKKLPKKNGALKAMDIILSLKVILPMLQDHVENLGGAQMDFDGPQDEAPQEVAASEETPVSEEKPKARGRKPKAKPKDEVKAAKPKDSNVTPIDFGSGAPA